jgi:hypothetical protein
MVKATQSWLRDHSTRSSRLHSPLVGRVPLKREVAAVIVVVAKVLREYSAQVPLVQDDHVVKALAGDRDQPSAGARCPPGPGTSPLAISRLSLRGSANATRAGLHPPQGHRGSGTGSPSPRRPWILSSTRSFSWWTRHPERIRRLDGTSSPTEVRSEVRAGAARSPPGSFQAHCTPHDFHPLSRPPRPSRATEGVPSESSTTPKALSSAPGRLRA